MKKSALFKLTVFHTNDIHGKIDSLPQYSTVVNEIRKKEKNVLLLDSGDIFLRGEYQSFSGMVERDIFCAMGYDAWVPGNNDFRVPFGDGTAEKSNRQLADIINNAAFEPVCANVIYKSTEKYMDGFNPYFIKNINGVKIGIIGVTSLKPQERNWNEVSDKYFERGDIAVEKIAAELKNKCDIMVVLSHCGINMDINIAETDGISAVFGADDHYALKRPIRIKNHSGNEIPIVQSGGEERHYLGRLDLYFEHKNGKYILNGYTSGFCDISETNADENILKIIDSYAETQSIIVA
ncbi:metallophosphoesterase [Anaerotignum sp. MSJ-24]|uniref:metallophosphoesterase n=1 Tax=Anaerotignum sp. MSJ-24 TaxID=2841521 RepID=UPI001C0FCFAD|nr:metallophosphoesterase [Anaerotignum sp. MSJ-24]MBU5463232.1 metallophosphoesterase [Anaerotignum sp. MSJ-24]